jgi:hypothetical protein
VNEFIDNAQRAGATKVEIEWTSTKDCFFATLHDNGRGIHFKGKGPVTIYQAFKPNKRVGGLRLVYRLLNSFNGYILIDKSERLGGAKIISCFPSIV